jgi:hypothetical protein
MGINSNDIAAQRAMLERGEEKRKADWKQAERERLRDTFAAASLTGYNANPAWDDTDAVIVAEQCYADADAMLRVRNGAVESRETVCPHVRGTVTQHCSLNFTLSDEEWRAIEECIKYAFPVTHPTAATLRKLLDRLK